MRSRFLLVVLGVLPASFANQRQRLRKQGGSGLSPKHYPRHWEDFHHSNDSNDIINRLSQTNNKRVETSRILLERLSQCAVRNGETCHESCKKVKRQSKAMEWSMVNCHDVVHDPSPLGCCPSCSTEFRCVMSFIAASDLWNQTECSLVLQDAYNYSNAITIQPHLNEIENDDDCNYIFEQCQDQVVRFDDTRSFNNATLQNELPQVLLWGCIVTSFLDLVNQQQQQQQLEKERVPTKTPQSSSLWAWPRPGLVVACASCVGQVLYRVPYVLV